MKKPARIGWFLGLFVSAFHVLADEPQKKVPNVNIENVLDGYDAAIKDVNAPVKDAIEASRARKNAQKAWTDPADSSLSRFTKEITSEWTFWGLVGLDLGKDIYIVNTAIQKTRRLKRDLEEAGKILEGKNQKLESVRTWETEMKGIHDALKTKLMALEKTAQDVMNNEGQAAYQASYDAFKKSYGDVQHELNTKIAGAKSPGVRLMLDQWEPIERLEESARQGIKMSKLEPEVASVVKQRSEILREHRIAGQLDQLATKHIPDAERTVQQSKEHIEQLEHRRGGWKWRGGRIAGITAIIFLPKVGWVIYVRRVKAANEAHVAEIQRILEDREERDGRSFNNLVIDHDDDVLPLRKTIVLVWRAFFDPDDPYLPQNKHLSEADLSCPVFDADDPIGGDTSPLKKLDDLKQSVLKELLSEASKAQDQAGTATVPDPRRRRSRQWYHRYFKIIFTKLLEERPMITADMDDRSIEDLKTQLSEAAYIQYAVIQQIEAQTRTLPPAAPGDKEDE